MGNLFDDSDEYPDYVPVVDLAERIEGMVVPLVIAGTFYTLCPAFHEEFDQPHAPHHDYHPVSIAEMAVIGSSGVSSITATPEAGRLSFTGHAPTVKIG